MTSNELLFLLFSLCQVCCIIIPVINKKKQHNEHKQYNWGDYSLIFFAIIGFGFSLFIFLSTQDQDRNKALLESNYKIELNNKLAERDSIHQTKDSLLTIYYGNKVDSSYSKSIAASNQALAKYNLVLIDSMNKVSKRINTNSLNLPQLTLEASSPQGNPLYLTEINNKPILRVKLKSVNNTAYNLNIFLCVLKIQSENDSMFAWQVISCDPFEDRSFITTDVVQTSEVDVKTEWLKLDRAIILFHGEYSSDIENKNKRAFDQAYEFNFVKGMMGYHIVGKSLQDILKVLKEKKRIN